jgi:hypothetical protein
MEESVEAPFIGEYMGKSTINLSAGQKFPWSFGQAKAKKIMGALDLVLLFAKSGEGNTSVKGKPAIELGDDKYPWAIDQSKAQAIVDNLGSVKEFAETGTLKE